ncbi:hypothetical protein ROA7450_01187 [Roseovarius albus]|uniref:Uncharacterized protein n=1 Tax=Roseovarius albus TaxID=1247867 RepID=A0A1X6YR26_9RHOB|nr:hypothetical protein ROA7450_01187 [Roseovarius albus]
MLTFSLNTFIKICLLDTGGRISEIQRKLDNSGGYDFYNSFQRAMRASLNGMPENHIDNILNTPSKEVERKHNSKAFRIVKGKFGNIRSI